MKDIVTSAFETRIPFPDEDKDCVQFYDQVLTQQNDNFLHIATSLAFEALRPVLVNAVPEAKAFVPADYMRGISYDRYNNALTTKTKLFSSLIGFAVDEKSGTATLRLPVAHMGSLYELPHYFGSWPSFVTEESGLTIHGNQNACALAISRLQEHKGQTAVIPLPRNQEGVFDALYDSKLNLAESPLDEVMDLAQFRDLVKWMKSFELRVITEPQERYDMATSKRVKDYFTGEIDKRIQVIGSKTVLILYANIEVPAKIASWITQQEEPDPRIGFQWFQTYMGRYLANNGPIPAEIQELPQVIEDTANLREIKLTNEHDLTVTFDGRILYMPTISNLKAYDAYMEALGENRVDTEFGPSFDPALHTIMQIDSQPATTEVEPVVDDDSGVTTEGEPAASGFKSKLPTNQFLYTDWRLNQLSYVTTVGTIGLESTSGCVPADASIEVKLLDTDMTKEAVSAAMADLVRLLRNEGKSLADFMKVEDFAELLPLNIRESYLASKTLQEAFDRIQAARLANQWERDPKKFTPHRLLMECRFLLVRATRVDTASVYGDDGFDYTLATDKATVAALYSWPGLQSIKRAIDFLNDKVKGNWSKLVGKHVSVTRGMTIFPFYSVIARYDNDQIVRDADRAAREVYLKPKLDPEYVPEPVPNINDKVSLLPHQVKADNHLKNDAPNVIAAVQAGGGKTFLGLIQALRATARGERTAIVCPNYLMKNYLEDGNYMTDGALNMICVDNQVFSSYGEERLGGLIKNAPPNTVTIIGLSVFSLGQNIQFSYNGEMLTINQVVEFLRNLGFDRVIIDESHFLANPSSNRSGSVARFLGGVGKKMEMTGTYINGTAVDALGQSRLLNPGILGTEEEFLNQYAMQTRGNKVTLWKPGAEKHIFQRLKSQVDYINIRRKEWVALLPERKETFHFVSLSKEQHRVYMSILDAVIKEIEQDETLAKKLNSGDEEDSEGLEAYLRRYLARIERYLACCELDELGSRMLTGEDRISPKSTKVNEILEKHFADPEMAKGKVIIFTSYRDSAKSIYDNLDPKFKRYAMHYVAERKDELVPIMKKDPNVKIVIGVEQSLNTGHNFQMFNRLIRIETVWNPGTLDQAESRLNRPDPKNKTAKRAHIHYDWICCNYTIDITKTARLISKLLSSAKFDEQDNHLYDNLPDLPVVSMTIDNIRDSNDFETVLQDYIDGYKMYQMAQKQDFEDYRKNAVHQEPVPLPSAGLMKGSAFMNVPYIPGHVIPFQEELGLVNIGDYAMEHGKGVLALDDKDLKGKRVHTEMGDGVIVNVSKYTVRVLLDKGGEKVSFNKLSTFLIPEDWSTKKSVKDLIIERIGLKPSKEPKAQRVDEVHPEDEDKEQIVLDEKPGKRGREPVPNKDTTENHRIEVFLAQINGNLAVNIGTDDPDADPKLMKKLGMTEIEPYYFAHMRTWKHFDQIIEKLVDKFEIPQDQIDLMDELLGAFTTGKKRLFNMKQANLKEVRNFFLIKRKTIPAPKLFIYPLIENGELYLCAWADQVSAKKLPRIRVPGVTWKIDEGFWTRFFRSKSEAKEFVQSLEDHGVLVTNMDDVKEQYAEIKVIKGA